MSRVLPLLLALAACSSNETPRGPRLTVVHEEAEAFELARAQGKRVLLHVTAEWALPSVEIDQALQRPRVAAALADDWILWRQDVGDASAEDEAVQDRHEAHNLPALRFLDADGTRLAQIDRVVTAEAIVETAERAADGKLRITGLDPKEGDAAGGTKIVLAGSGFTAEGARQVIVHFGARQGEVVTIRNDRIVVTAPPGEPGTTVDLRVLFEPGGQLTLPGAFRYR
jgi:hypothetical protein